LIGAKGTLKGMRFDRRNVREFLLWHLFLSEVSLQLPTGLGSKNRCEFEET
jgi:hypothetical protein